MTGKPQHDRPRVKVSLNLYAEDLQAIEDLAHRLKREQNHPRKWGKGNLMEAWIKEGLQREQQPQTDSTKRRTVAGHPHPPAAPNSDVAEPADDVP